MASSTTKPKMSTRELLIQVTVDALDEVGEPNIRLENILATSGVSVSSLYHYFGNLRGLVDAANVARFNRVYLLDIESTRAALDKTRTKDEFRAMVISMMEDIFLPSRNTNRRHRLLAFSGLDNNPEFVEAISQAHRSNALATSEILASAKNRGFVPVDFDPVAFGVWLSAQAFGLAVTEIMNDDVLNDKWRDQTLRATLHLLGLND
jgi:AcrR family transcriptional regulator